MPLWTWIKWPLLVVLGLLMFRLLYRLRRRGVSRRSGGCWPGAVASDSGSSLRQASACTSTHFASYNRVYGALGAAVAFLVWAWVVNLALLVGVEVNRELERRGDACQPSSRILSHPLSAAIRGVTPMPELNELQQELRRLAAERDVVILAHNYQRPEVQDAADYTGDSLELSRIAQKDEHSVILFCGVHFMAETAYILSPQKTVLMPDKRAGCPMADMVTVAGLRKLKAEHPDAVVVAYVNTSADIKAETDVCCTSANAVQIVERFPKDQQIIFVPDRNLGDYVARQTGREETMIMWQGWCHVHDDFRAAEIELIRAANPGSVLMAHPESRREVLDIADVVTSTSGMLRYPAGSDATTFIVATETGLLYRLGELYPDKKFIPASSRAICPNMKLTTLEKCVATLGDEWDDVLEHEVTVPEHIRVKALRAVERMIG